MHEHGKINGNGGASSGTTPFAASVILNSIIVVFQIVLGIMANSMALVTDAVHNFSDVVGLLLAWWAVVLSRREATSTHTYGFRKTTIMAALANYILLLLAVGAICLEAVKRLFQQPEVSGNIMIIAAAIGAVVNLASAIPFIKGRKKDLNLRAAFTHLIGDAAVSLGVIAAGVIIKFTGWNVIDPLIGIGVSVVIVIGMWSMLKQSLNLAIDAAPEHLNVEKVGDYLKSCQGVGGVHDLHVWAMSTTETALTVHLVADEGKGKIELDGITEALEEKFGICHSTIQVETIRCECNNNCGLK